MTERRPPLVAWYGDDLTGSTDVLEALGAGGVPAVLFLAAPSAERLATAFPGRRAVGVAGVARSLATAEIGDEIAPILAALAALQPALVHYKVSSTFDGSPDVGSIGVAIDAAWPILEPDWVPVLVAAPALGRYTVFGTHFATFAGAVYRLDRHPVMARHPVTPMHEADLRRHLTMQTDRAIGLVDVLALTRRETASDVLDVELAAGRRVVVLDGLDARTVAAAARLAWERRTADRPGFVVGSSGVEAGLLDVWREDRVVEAPDAGRDTVTASGPVVAVSGSASEWTARQIRRAVEAGWVGLPFETERFLRDPEAVVERARAEAAAVLGRGRNVVVHAALGPDDPRIERTRGAAAATGLTERNLGRRLGEGLGQVASALVRSTSTRRVVIAGGDASGWAARALGVEALDYVRSMDPGVPLTRATGPGPVDGLELVLKSGQLGGEDLLVRLGGD